ncbi:MAG: ABC transporter permease [Planctomycetes bacterium]|nr:ABC transporter permease [Planctomycetota bacterium]
MFALYRTLSLRYLSRRWFRAALVVASIMLGVATLVATQALSETMSKATLASGNPMAGTIDLIVSNGEAPIDRALVKAIEQVKGVKDVQAKIFDHVKLIVGDKKIRVQVMGFDLREDRKQGNALEEKFKLSAKKEEVEGAFALVFPWGTPAILGKELHNDLEKENLPSFLGFKNLTIENKVVGKNSKPHTVTSIAWMEPKETNGDYTAFGGYVIILHLDHAANILGMKEGMARQIDIALEPGVDPKKARVAIEKVVGGQGVVRTMEEQNQSLQSAMTGMKAGFSMCGVAALIVGMFLVYNSLSVSVAERRHEIGILLALGATRDQVWRLFAGEACVLGALGAGLGIPLGYGLAHLGLRPMQEAIGDVFASMNLKQIELTGELIALAFAVGILSALVASMVPAIQAAYEKPAEAVRRVPKEPPVSHLVAHIVAVCVLILSGMSMILVRDHIPKRWGTFGGLILVMTGALLAAPLVAQIGARALLPISRRFFSIEWRIAADNMVRAPGRTGMVIGALAAGVCLIVETAGIIRSNREAILDWLETSVASDLIVTSGSPVGSGGQNNQMEESIGDELKKIPGVEEVLPNRMRTDVDFRNVRVAVSTAVADRSYVLEHARLKRFDSPEVVARRTKEIELYKTMEQEKNSVIISGNFAALYHVHKGDHITLKTPKGEVKFHVIGAVEDYSWNLGTIYMNRKDYIAHWEDTTVTVFEVYLQSGVNPDDAKNKIAAKLGAQYDLHPLTRAELRVRVVKIIEDLYLVALGQEVVVVVVAALGVVMALLISVLQRRREMGLLRAIGASQAQVIYLVLAEATLMGIFGSVLGVIFAVPVQWYALQIVFLEEAGQIFPVYLPWWESVVIALIAMAIAALAGVGPALYAVRERIPEAIAYE